ncbi:MAG: hypothetical protein K2N63_01260 [Lachnospiraceae bacterium]|nr:hypothetical protein [Lachnospiraceae bacterium]
MSEGNILSAGLNELRELKELLVCLENDKALNLELSAKEAQMEKQIQMLKKQLSDKTALVAKQRNAELCATYDEQLEKTKSRLKKVRAKKEKEKSTLVSDRIAAETSETREEGRQLYEQIRQLYKEVRIPRFLNNTFVHALFIPQGFQDILIILLTLAVVLFLLPCGIYYLAFRPETVFLIVLYIVTVLVFGGLYMAVSKVTKERHPKTFEKVKALRRELKANRKKIHSMERAIRKDKDESQYDLEKFNSELKELEDEIERISGDKKAALKKFDTETKAVIAADLAAEFAKELNPLQQEYEQTYEQQRRTEESVKNLSMKLTSEYNSYLGKENLDIGMVDGLIRIMEAGRAETVKDALNIYRSGQGSVENGQEEKAVDGGDDMVGKEAEESVDDRETVINPTDFANPENGDLKEKRISDEL